MVEPESHLRLVPTACPTRSTRPKRITTSTSTGNIRKKLAKTGKNATSAISHIRICDLTWNELTGKGRKRSGNVHSATSVFVIGSDHTFSLFGYSFLKVDFVNYFTKILKFKKNIHFSSNYLEHCNQTHLESVLKKWVLCQECKLYFPSKVNNGVDPPYYNNVQPWPCYTTSLMTH